MAKKKATTNKLQGVVVLAALKQLCETLGIELGATNWISVEFGDVNTRPSKTKGPHVSIRTSPMMFRH